MDGFLVHINGLRAGRLWARSSRATGGAAILGIMRLCCCLMTTNMGKAVPGWAIRYAGAVLGCLLSGPWEHSVCNCDRPRSSMGATTGTASPRGAFRKAFHCRSHLDRCNCLPGLPSPVTRFV